MNNVDKIIEKRPTILNAYVFARIDIGLSSRLKLWYGLYKAQPRPLCGVSIEQIVFRSINLHAT